MAVDRHRLVNRHNPVLRKINPFSPLSVGNGELAFTADITGMQTFTDEYKENIPLCTQSQWGWHICPAGSEKYNYDLKDLQLKFYEANNHKVGYPTSAKDQEEIFNWLRVNPHRLHLGQIAMNIKLEDGNSAKVSDVKDISQKLDMWEGMLTSSFSLEDSPITTKTCCHPYLDILSFSVKSPLLQKHRIEINIAFPYGSPDKSAADWNADDRHSTEVLKYEGNTLDLLRIIDNDRYFVSISTTENAMVKKVGRNRLIIRTDGNLDELKFSVCFNQLPRRQKNSLFDETADACREYWIDYWSKGGIIELSESSDERAMELERRIVLSQYLTAIQCSGSIPSQETGLTCNSWYGKFHLEMHWWHAAHFALWGRTEYLERSMWWYMSILPKAIKLAKSQGYRGARWPKMVSYEGINSPSTIAPLLIWQQPHPIYFAELIYRAHEDYETLEAYKDMVFETAEFMTSFAEYDKGRDCYNLGPGIIPAQENHNPEITLNPTYELEYWVFGLNKANEWRERLGLDINPLWKEVAEKMAALPVKDSVYLSHENCPDTYEKFNYDHPSMLAAFGVLAGQRVNKSIMLDTLNKVINEWRLDSVWGWDFPMIAMAAARLGKPEIAIDMLLYESPKNIYLPNGHNRQGMLKDNLLGVEVLPLYLPGNGALLTAVAMMAAGWDGYSSTDTPGFPKDGRWKISYEDLRPIL